MSGPDSVGFLLTLAPGEPRGEALLEEAAEAVSSGGRVGLYLLDEGVRHLGREELAGLQDRGLKLYCCAYGAQRRGIEPDGRAVFSGLYLLASLIASSGRFRAA